MLMKRFLFLLATVTLAGCNLSTGPKVIPSDPATETFASSLGIDIPSMTKTTAGDYYKDLTVGTGAAVAGDALVGFAYVAYLTTGVAFTSGSIPSGKRLDQVILGLQDGMQGMKVGGRRLIVIPSQYAYSSGSFTDGSTGVTVPPNSTLIFDITLTAAAPPL